MARFAPRKIATAASANLAPSNNTSYRCPGCGQEVDGTDRNAVTRHHIHVLHPHLFRFKSVNHQTHLNPRETRNRVSRGGYHFPPEERLAILKAADPERKWYSLDDKRICSICDRVFTGRQIDIQSNHQGHYFLACPTAVCPSNISHWFLCEVSPALYQKELDQAQGEFSFSVARRITVGR